MSTVCGGGERIFNSVDGFRACRSQQLLILFFFFSSPILLHNISKESILRSKAEGKRENPCHMSSTTEEFKMLFTNAKKKLPFEMMKSLSLLPSSTFSF